MGFVEKRSADGRYRARYRDPLGRQRSRSFGRKADAQRFLVEMEPDKVRKSWIDPRGADMAVATGRGVPAPWPAAVAHVAADLPEGPQPLCRATVR